MKVWLDDVRPKPPEFDAWVKDADMAIRMLRVGGVKVISLDHDLGEAQAKTGYDVAKFIEEAAYKGTLDPLDVQIHSANPVGKKLMQVAISRAQLFWSHRTANK